MNELPPKFTLSTPPPPNWEITFGTSREVIFRLYIKTPPNKIQRWFIRKILGIEWNSISE